jgi:TolB protein
MIPHISGVVSVQVRLGRPLQLQRPRRRGRRIARSLAGALFVLLGGVLAATATAHKTARPSLLTFAKLNTARPGSHLCIGRPDGASLHLLGARGWQPGRSSWSPDGRYLAFEADTASAGYYGSTHLTDIFIATARGRIVRNLTKRLAAGDMLDPAWSPNGRWIAFAAHGGGLDDPYVLRVVHPDGSGVRSLHLVGTHPTWAPDSRRLAYQGEGGIFIANLRGGTPPTLIVPGAYAPSWSPNGATIAYSTDGFGLRSDVWAAHPNGSDPHNLTNTSGIGEADPIWSPGGRMLAFTYYFDRGAPAYEVDVGVMSASGTNPRTVVHEAWTPSWRPPRVLPKQRRHPC